ncbi:NDP-sugar synthase [Candidatus Albibeggiatoa sp. nov. NOAA]|uniref:NDP-sugar synthase n=1 Tax=Candidatus Albibeggiatoa sp. nov. NOAA TaxID=3162724 RepID=UPI0032F2ABBB|nr:NDP-sugar synthase [Thiotrichaceae bacterium]
MKAILFANRDGTDLAPLTNKTCVAMLPIAAKPLIEYALESLIMTEIREVILVVSYHAEDVEKHVKCGERWGHHVEYVLAQNDESPSHILKRLGNTLRDDQYLVMRADMLQSINLKQFVEQAKQFHAPEVVATIDNQPIGIALLNQQACKHSQLLNCDSIKQANLYGAEQVKLDGQFALLDSLQNYFDTNFAVAQLNFSHLVINGRQINEHLRVGRRSKITEAQQGLVGDYCNIHPQVTLNNAVLGHEVIIDRHAIVKDSLVLNNTYIGEGVELTNAIVWGNRVLRLDLGAKVTLTDTLLIADLTQVGIGRLLSKLINQGLGLVLLLLSLPLWLAAFIFSLLSMPKPLFRRVRLVGNQQEISDTGQCQLRSFNSWEWSTKIPILRYLPRLFAVIAGHIRIVGVTPPTPQSQTVQHLQTTSIGLIGPSQIDIPYSAPQEEHQLAESYYVHTRRFRSDVVWLIRGFITLFKPKAWMPIKEENV